MCAGDSDCVQVATNGAPPCSPFVRESVLCLFQISVNISPLPTENSKSNHSQFLPKRKTTVVSPVGTKARDLYLPRGWLHQPSRRAHHGNHFSPVINHRFRICAKPQQQQQQQLKNKVGTDIQPATITSPVKFKHRLGRIEGSVSNNKWSSIVTEILHKSVTITTS